MKVKNETQILGDNVHMQFSSENENKQMMNSVYWFKYDNIAKEIVHGLKIIKALHVVSEGRLEITIGDNKFLTQNATMDNLCSTEGSISVKYKNKFLYSLDVDSNKVVTVVENEVPVDYIEYTLKNVNFGYSLYKGNRSIGPFAVEGMSLGFRDTAQAHCEAYINSTGKLDEESENYVYDAQDTNMSPVMTLEGTTYGRYNKIYGDILANDLQRSINISLGINYVTVSYVNSAFVIEIMHEDSQFVEIYDIPAKGNLATILGLTSGTFIQGIKRPVGCFVEIGGKEYEITLADHDKLRIKKPVEDVAEVDTISVVDHTDAKSYIWLLGE